MKVNVTKERVLITESVVINESEFNVNLCEFELPECFQGLTVTAAFNNIPVPLTGTQCYVPNLKSGTAILGVYAYKEGADGELQLMYSPKPTSFYVSKGSYSDKTAAAEAPTVSEFERYCATVSALTFPKSDVVGKVDLENEFNDTQVYSVSAVNSALSEIAEVLDNAYQEMGQLSGSAEKISNRVTEINELSTDAQYPSAAAVYRELCKQTDKTAQVRSEIAAEIRDLSGDLERAASELNDNVSVVDNRVTEVRSAIDAVIDRESATSNRITTLQGQADLLQEQADRLSAEISENKADVSELENMAQGIQMDLNNLSDELDVLRDSVNSRVLDNASSIKGNVTGTGTIELNDVSPHSHYLNVIVEGNRETDVIECRGKNMLSFSNRTLVSFELGNHTFTGENIFLSIAGNGVTAPNIGSFSFDDASQTLTVDCGRSWLGLGLDYKVEGSSKYIVSVQSVTEGFAVVASFFDADGNYISYISGVENSAFTTPSNAEWMIVIFTGKTKDTTGVFVKPQLEKGDSATEYQPYVEPQRAVAGADGVVNSFISRYPVTILSSDNPSVDISCVYNKDTDKAYKELVAAIAALGGSV